MLNDHVITDMVYKDKTPVQSSPTELQRGTSSFALPRSALNFDRYDHKFKGEHETASVTLNQDNKYNELTMKCRMLMGKLQKVDVTVVIESVIVGNKKVMREKSSEIPFNFTDLGAAIKVAGNARFEKVKPWGHKAKNTDKTEAAFINSEVYFDFAFSCDQDPETIINSIRIKWRRQGGNRLDIKLLDFLTRRRCWWCT